MKTPTTKQFLIRIIATITLVESTIMVFIVMMPFQLEPSVEVILDTALLVALSTPVIYLWIIKPYLVAHKAQIANILENTNDAYLTLDKDWIITYVNPVTETLLNIKPDAMIGRDLRAALPDVVSVFYKMLRATFTAQGAQVRTVLYGPTMKYLEANSYPTTEGLILSLRDITKRVNVEESLRHAKEKEHRDEEVVRLAVELDSYMKAIDEHALVSVTDSAGTIISANDKFCEITGYSREELVGQNHRIINSGTHPKAFFAELWATIASGQKWHGQICNCAKNGKLYWVDSAIVPIKNADGVIERYVSVRIDITEQKQQAEKINIAYQELAEANSQLEQLSRIDGLTKIANRRYFDETLATEISILSRTSIPLTLILCDIDYFKNYNDSYGHPAGDACLQQVAQAISSNFFRAGDLVARYGGEEFAVILPNVDKEAALMLAERMRENVAKLKLEHNASAVAEIVTISVGVTSLVPDRDTQMLMIIKKADEALYSAKGAGRNNVRYCPLL